MVLEGPTGDDVYAKLESGPGAFGDRVARAAYLGKGEVFDLAMTAFAYATQHQRHHQALVAAVNAGRGEAAVGIWPSGAGSG